MSIPTRESIVGIIKSQPRFTETAGGLRFFARIKVSVPRRGAGGAVTGWDDRYCNLVAFGVAARKARSRIRYDDVIVAAGRTEPYNTVRGGKPVTEEAFVADTFGHSATHTTYRLVRTARRRREREHADQPNLALPQTA